MAPISRAAALLCLVTLPEQHKTQSGAFFAASARVPGFCILAGASHVTVRPVASPRSPPHYTSFFHPGLTWPWRLWLSSCDFLRSCRPLHGPAIFSAYLFNASPTTPFAPQLAQPFYLWLNLLLYPATAHSLQLTTPPPHQKAS